MVFNILWAPIAKYDAAFNDNFSVLRFLLGEPQNVTNGGTENLLPPLAALYLVSQSNGLAPV